MELEEGGRSREEQSEGADYIIENRTGLRHAKNRDHLDDSGT